MPPRHHRTLDRAVAILELVARSKQGLTLARISEELEAPKTSLHELVNGLLATGYLAEHNRRLYLGPGPFVLSMIANRGAATRLSHEVVEQISRDVGFSVLAGIAVGDSVVYIDHAGDNLALEFVARNHSRRPLFSTASGKIVLAAMEPRTMDGNLLAAPVRDREAVEAFLAELPSIRRERLAYNRGVTLPGILAVATPLVDRNGDLVAAISVPVADDQEARLGEIGTRLRDVVSAVVL